MFKHLQSLFNQLTSPKPKPKVPPGLTVTASPLLIFNKPKTSWLPNPTKKPHTVISIPLESLRILTWNIDYVSRDPPLRMHVLLTHLQSLLGDSPSPIMILLQEVHPKALELMLEYTWVRDNFAVTNTALPGHSQAYGTVTLVAKILAPSVGCCFRVPYKDSAMGRDALFVDLRIVMSRSAGTKKGRRVVRVGNTHLESLQGNGIARRQVQMTVIKDVLSVSNVYAGLVGGDMNAIAVEDMDLVDRVGLKDLWVGEGGETWGYQPPCMFPPGRLDKILVAGYVGLAQGAQVELVGVGLKAGLGEDGECYVSDHYGLLSTVQVGAPASLED